MSFQLSTYRCLTLIEIEVDSARASLRNKPWYSQKNRGEKQGILVIILETKAKTLQADGTCINKM